MTRKKGWIKRGNKEIHNQQYLHASGHIQDKIDIKRKKNKNDKSFKNYGFQKMTFI